MFELDESYLRAKRVRGKRGWCAAGKTPALGLLKRSGKIFVNIVDRCSREELMPIIQGKILEVSTIHTDGWRAYDGLVVNGVSDEKFIYHLKECEFRSNNREKELNKIVWKLFCKCSKQK